MRTLPKNIVTALRGWRACFWIWNILQYALGLFAALGAALIAADKSARDYVLVATAIPVTFSIAVALATAALTFLRATPKANAYIQAWRHLHNECLIYEADENYTDKMLAEAHKQGEAIIAKSDG